MQKKLYRSKSRRMVSGVCGGLEDYLGIDVTIIRLVWVIFSVMTGFFPGLITYIIATVIIPEDPAENDNWTENGENMWRTKNDSYESPYKETKNHYSETKNPSNTNTDRDDTKTEK